MSDDVVTTEPTALDVDELLAEIARLRALVGPTEQSYDDLRLDLLAARDAAKGAEAAAGALRGKVAELHVMLDRALQDHDHFQRIYVGRGKSMITRAKRSVRARFF